MINKYRLFFSKLFRIKDLKYILIFKKIKNPIFLRYFFLIFLLIITAYLTVPNFINYSKKYSYIKIHLNKDYGIEINNYKNISYELLPSPRLKLTDVNFNLENEITNNKVKTMILVLDINNLYNFKELNIKKLYIKNSNIKLKLKDFENLSKYLGTLKKFLIINNSNLQIFKKKKEILKFSNISFDNLKKNTLLMKGYLFKKKYSFVLFKNELEKKLIFDIPKIGSKSTLFLSNDSDFESQNGRVNSKILKNNISFDFKNKNNFELTNSSFRNNLINTSFDGKIEYYPFFNFNLAFGIKDIKFKKLYNYLINRNVNYFSLINNKINGNFKIILDKKNSNNKFLKSFNINGEIENRKLFIKESLFNFDGGFLTFSGSLSDVEGYQKIIFDINGTFKDADKIYKKLKIMNKKDNTFNNFQIRGFLNLGANRIYFEDILTDNYRAKKEDLKYFKANFEKIILKNNLKNIFDKEKIRKFALEIN